MQQISKPTSNKMANMGVLCSLFVVLIHVPFSVVSTSIGSISHRILVGTICEIAVPYFFLAAGYFLAGHIGETNWWKIEVVKRTRSILLPSIFFSIIYLVYQLTTKSCKIDDVNVPQVIGINLLSAPFYGRVWFLRTVFLLTLMSPLLQKLADRISLILMGFLYLSVETYLGTDWFFAPSHHFWTFTLPPRSVLYYTAGIFLRKTQINMPHKSLLTAFIVAVAACAFGIPILIIIKYKFCIQNLPIVPMAIPLLMFVVFYIIPSSQWPKWLTSATFPIFLLHYFPIQLCIKITGCQNFNMFESCLVSLFTFALSLGISMTFKKVSPKLHSILFGGR